jgi:DNA-binding transcriptional ArsR family regulator
MSFDAARIRLAAARRGGHHGVVSADGDAHTRVDFSVSVHPLATVATNVVEMLGPLGHRLPTQVLRRARAAVRSIDTRPIVDAYLADPLGRGVPDLLIGDGLPDADTFDQALEQLRAVPDDDLRRDIAGTFGHDVPSPYRRWLDAPHRHLAALCAALRAYHDAVVRPLLPHLARDLAREQFRLQRLAAEGDADLLLTRLHPTVTFDGKAVAVSGDRDPSPHRHSTVIVVPIASASRTIAYNFTTPINHLRLCLPGSGLRLDQLLGRRDPRPDLLAVLIGDNRARLLRSLRRPGTTTDLAAELWLAPSTVSHHLKALRRAGLVRPHRIGPMVYYELNDRGQRLLALYARR